MNKYYKIITAKAPVNIAVIKYWGKADEKLKVPINDSLSGTLSIDEMCATTSVAISSAFDEDQLWLNGKEQDISPESHAGILLNQVKNLSKLESNILDYKIHIVSYNNFPTAAGLASSAAGYACLAFVLGNAYGITELTLLSKLARRGSGSACRSLFGGFVRWNKGVDHESSLAVQVADENHWPEMSVIICVISDHQKDVSSSLGMSKSVETSHLLAYRARELVPQRIAAISEAISDKNFHLFAEVTMKDSNQFHAVCLDTYPPIFYLNDASRQVIKICSIINSFYNQNRVAYTFDAGPNACIYLLDDFVPIFVKVMQHFFPQNGDKGSINKLQVRGRSHQECEVIDEELLRTLITERVQEMPGSISYLINTKIGCGPALTQEHLVHEALNP